jgi:hypothetical protein
MSQAATTPLPSELSYLDAANVESPAGKLSELELVNADGERVGSIAGVVIEAAARRVRYLDVQADGWLRRRHYLVAADHLAQVDSAQKVLRLLDSEIAEVRDVDPAALHLFADDELLATVFSSRVA